jgi:Cytochrome c554 and c-prime
MARRALPLLLLVAACRRTPAPAAPDAAPAAPAAAPWSPATLDAASYAGAAACADCHRAQYDRWRASPHGRAMARAEPGAVLGDFSGAPIALAGGTVTPRRDGDGYAMDIATRSGSGTFRVELTLGSGRQHQLYLTRAPTGALQLLPIYWATRTREWVDTTLHRGTSLDPQDPRAWSRLDIATDGNCLYCHLSQGRARASAGRVEHAFVDLPINCEACHGPARAHVEARRAGREGSPLANPKNLDRAEEATLCGRCHAAQRPFHDEGRALLHYATPATPLLRADATQHGTGYQYAGHVTSGCFTRGAASCSGCHDPHRQTPRDLTGAPADGPRADRQCTVCHRDRTDERTARAHAHHPAGVTVRCIDCHMPEHYLFDDPASRQRVADHAISIPRPQETIDLHLPNACANCHPQGPAWALAALRRWGAKRALDTRPWVRAVDLGKHKDPASLRPLLAALADPATPPFARATALDLVAGLPPDPAAAAALAPLAEERDPYLRGLSLRALWIHDLPRSATWAAGAASDPDPMVRIVALDALGRAPFTEDQIDLLAADAVRLSDMPPAAVLAFLARRSAAAGHPAQARRLADLALARATPLEIDRLSLRALRAEIAP